MKKLYRITALILIMLISVPMFTLSAFAADPVSTVISARVSVTGTSQIRSENYTVVLEAMDSSNPMPGGNVGGKYSMTITGAAKKDFPLITYSKVGVYQYKIYQLAGTVSREHYDSTVYYATVYVLNSETVDDVMTITVVLRKGTGEKPAEVVFNNVFYSSPKTGDTSNIALYAALCVLSAAAVATAVVIIRKRKNKD